MALPAKQIQARPSACEKGVRKRAAERAGSCRAESPCQKGLSAGSLWHGFGGQRQIAAPVAALALLTILRLALAAVVPLTPDEAYYWVWSRALAAGYIDHPPVIALWIWAGTITAGDSALGIRLLGPISAFVGSVLLWDAAERLFPGREAGLVAAGLLNSTILVGVGAIAATPDSPLLFFWMSGLWAMVRLVTGDRAGWWLAVGLFAGLALASKYTGVLFPLGIALWLGLTGRRWIGRYAPYAGAVLMLVTVAPVLWWNARHDWIGLLRQGGRVGNWLPSAAPRFISELLGGQIALVTPLTFLLFSAGLGVAAQRAWQKRDPRCGLLALLGLLPGLVFLQHAIGDRVQANWPAICYPAAAIAAAGLTGRIWRHLELPAIILGALITAGVYVQAWLAPLPLPAKLDPIALQMGGWRDLADRVEETRRRIGASFVAADNYGIASELARNLPPGVPVVAIGPRWASFDLPVPNLAGAAGVLVQPETHAVPIWRQAQQVGTAKRERRGVVIQTYSLYRAVPDHSTTTVLLPRPMIP